MKLISLWEPWATLMSLGAKTIETRSWPTSYRGWLAIQASKGGLNMADLEEACLDSQFYEALQKFEPFAARNGRKGWIKEVFPHGHIVAVVKLIGCRPTKTFTNITSQEFAFGNYDGDRFGWQTDNLFRLPKPIPFKAKQGLCDVPEDVVRQIREQFKGGAI